NMIFSKAYLNMYKRGQEDMENEINKIKSAFKSGIEMRKELEKNQEENKIQTIAYKLLNSAKTGNKNLFLDTLMRLYINRSIEVPKAIFEMIHESNMDFETLAQSYIAGLISKPTNTESSEK
ncbi:MAG: type I-B CRISPR-associated protein Cas8b1/Cst1, partial [Fervidobacterium sp.]